jgi:hypothetical protein
MRCVRFLTAGLLTPRQKPAHAALLACIWLVAPTDRAVAESEPAIAEVEDSFLLAVEAVKSAEFKRAVILFNELAQQDDYEAQYNLALLLRAGQGKPQSFVRALEWAWLAHLGGVEPAARLSEDLMAVTTPAAQSEILERIDERLQARLARGDRTAVMQYVAFNRTILPQPDLQRAYIWSLLASALGIDTAIQTRNEIAKLLETSDILEAQNTAQQMFSDQDMANLFSVSASSSR